VIIKTIKNFENAVVVITTFESDSLHTLELGKQELTPRWRAAGKQLAHQNLLEDVELVQVDAGLHNFSHSVGKYMNTYIYDQDVTFFFEKRLVK
jgi:hypothetical protein